jgi:hypothetical protein
MKGYKAFNSDFTCRDYQFSENSEHKVDGKPILCFQGFHFCTEMNDCFKYYSLTEDTILCEIEALGDVISEPDYTKHATNHIKILNRVELDFDELLDELSNHKDSSLRYEAASNTKTSSKILAKLSNDDDWVVRYQVAQNPNTSSKILAKLSNDVDGDVRYQVAKNPNTSSKILAKLSNDFHWDVREQVAQNPNTSSKILAKLSNDVDEDVRNTVGINPNYKK